MTKFNKTLALLLTSATLAGFTIYPVHAQSTTEPLVLADELPIDTETRDALSQSLRSTRDDVRDVVEKLLAARNALVRCLSALPSQQGKITDEMGEDQCLFQEALASRDELAQMSVVLARTADDVRLSAEDYGAHSQAIDTQVDGYAAEVDRINGERAELVTYGQKIKEYMATGKALTPEQRKQALKVAYRDKRLAARREAVDQIVNNLMSERDLFRTFETNLQNAADRLDGEGLAFATSVEIQNDWLEVAESRARLRSGAYLSAATRDDWASLEGTLGELDGVLDMLGRDRRTARGPLQVALDEQQAWSAAEEDSVLSSFLDSIGTDNELNQ